ncbi:hypothetical protein D3879_24820 [Pseudomonas cavernicola]|uniref:HEPN/Toprim N-terminal domain-containing protein n=1 Tax=Pseudomonas cavernicola TaxID=2320866 RepID=A0A418X995_9PSED|nr:HEPN/Toprim-associated domain-containing protein [Pseudomonas cavernicola]RJG09040.1 hypothetical protein D3879_24820 [Pseudomonas cavernicola]
MSSWTDIRLGGMSLIETQNHFNIWYFRKSERVLEKEPVTGDLIYKYVMSGATLRRRLELDGHNMASLQKEFDRQLAQMKRDCLDMIAIEPNGKRIGLTVGKALGTTPHGHRHIKAKSEVQLAGYSEPMTGLAGSSQPLLASG